MSLLFQNHPARIVVLAGILCFPFFAKAQDFTITGTLNDKQSKTPLEAATVFLETVKDSTLITYTITNQEGFFELKGRNQVKDARINISFIGYEDFIKVIDLSEGDIRFGSIEVGVSTATLGAVVVKSRAPVTVKKDTLEFNVSSFKTKKDATVEDLLKELPGVEVDPDGKILVNGKEVNKILVNGKPFFSDDPTIATRNLTKEIIEKIQVVDTKTDDEAFTKEDGDQDNKTINLTISEEKNKGVFGRVAAGGGTDDRFEYAGILNSFDNDRRISVLGGGNNINSAGFSFGEIQKMFSGARSISYSSNGNFSIDGRGFGGGQGIVNSRSAGANYTDEYAEGFDASLDYFYSGANNFEDRTSERENILPDRRFFTNSSSRTDGNADSHGANAIINIKKDSTLLVNIRPSFSFANGETRYRRNEESLDEDGTQINESNTNNFTIDEGREFENNLSITKKWGDRGSFVRARVQNEINRIKNEDFIMSRTEIFGEDPDIIERNQFTNGETDTDGYNVSLTYSTPIVFEKLTMEMELNHRNDLRSRRRSTFDFNDDSQGFDLFNEELSTDFEGRNIRTFPEIAFRYRTDKVTLRGSTGYVFRTLENNDRLRPELDSAQDFTALEFNTYLNYKFTPKLSLYANASKNNAPPALEQLNPFVDVSDPLDVRQGNPDLGPTNNYRLYANLRNYDFQSGAGYGFYINGDIADDAVVAKTLIDENLVRSTTFENVDGNYNVYMSASYNKKIKIDSLRSVKLGARFFGSLSRSVNFNNNVQYRSKRRSLGPGLNASFEWKDIFNINARYGLNLTTNEFGIDAFEDQEFTSHDLSLQTGFIAIKHLEWRNDINYNYNPNIAAGFPRSAWFWNSTVAYSFAQEKATATLKVYDLLDQNTNARRSANANFIEDVQSTVLQQYVMLSLSWKFNTLGKKGETRENNFRFF